MLNASSSFSARLLDKRIVRFLLAGGLAAILNFGSRFFYNIFVDFSTAVTLAFMTGLTTAYILNKLFVFTSSGNSRTKEIGWFVFVNILALAQTLASSVYLTQLLPEYIPAEGPAGRGLVDAIAHGAGVLLPALTSYIGHTYLTFRK